MAVDDNINNMPLSIEQAIKILEEVLRFKKDELLIKKKQQPESLDSVLRITPSQILLLKWIKKYADELAFHVDDYFYSFSIKDTSGKAFEFLQDVVNYRLADANLPKIKLTVDLVEIPDEYFFCENTPKEEQSEELYEEMQKESYDMWRRSFGDVNDYIDAIERKYGVVI